MPLLNQICSYLNDTVVLISAKVVEVVTCAGQAGVEVVKKIILLD